MQLHELIPTGELIQDIEKGFVRVQHHPTLPLSIYNYTEQAQFQRHWTTATLNCRGLIVNRDTEEIMARPFKKFFNDQENPSNQAVFQQGPVEVTDKLDGSLGILYDAGRGNLAVATRGSFTSEQALHATELLRRKYPAFWPPYGWTLLFEILYPENRIVVDYGDTDDLVLLGGVQIHSGMSGGPESFSDWPGPKAEVFPYTDYSEALRAPHRPGKEGLVLFWPETEFRVKMKQQDYVELHRIVTGLNERSIWQRLTEGRDVFDGIPDELHDWVDEVANPMLLDFTVYKNRATRAFDRVSEILMGRGWLTMKFNRKEFAELVRDYEPWLKTCMFMLLDGKNIDDFLWKQLRPVGPTKRARGGGEDVA